MIRVLMKTVIEGLWLWRPVSYSLLLHSSGSHIPGGGCALKLQR
jgi:hypothetical protein